MLLAALMLVLIGISRPLVVQQSFAWLVGVLSILMRVGGWTGKICMSTFIYDLSNNTRDV